MQFSANPFCSLARAVPPESSPARSGQESRANAGLIDVGELILDEASPRGSVADTVSHFESISDGRLPSNVRITGNSPQRSAGLIGPLERLRRELRAT